MEKETGKLLVIIGPTAVGKTKLSIELAKRFNGEIISGDSMQIYRGLDIGTAKITDTEREGIVHHLLDIKEPEEAFSAAEFQELAVSAINDIHKRNKLPIIVGGTGLYIQSVLYDYQFSEAASDPAYRAMLEKELEDEGVLALYEQLKEIDPESAERIHPNNTRRVIRALEIYHCTGGTMSEDLNNQPNKLRYDTALLGLTMERDLLYERIDSRVDIMVKEGLLDEVTEKLYNKGLKNCQSIQAIGYKEIYRYLDGEVSKEDAIEILKRNSRRYAKRQLTWFRNKMAVNWFDMTDLEGFSKKLEEISVFVAGKLSIKANK